MMSNITRISRKVSTDAFVSPLGRIPKTNSGAGAGPSYFIQRNVFVTNLIIIDRSKQLMQARILLAFLLVEIEWIHTKEKFIVS